MNGHCQAVTRPPKGRENMKQFTLFLPPHDRQGHGFVRKGGHCHDSMFIITDREMMLHRLKNLSFSHTGKLA